MAVEEQSAVGAVGRREEGQNDIDAGCLQQGPSIEEIGGVLNLKASAAKHSIFRAVQKLRRSLEPLGELKP